MAKIAPIRADDDQVDFCDPFWRGRGQPEVVACSPEQIAQIEAALGVRLPQAYVSKLLRLDGGYVRREMVRVDPYESEGFSKVSGALKVGLFLDLAEVRRQPGTSQFEPPLKGVVEFGREEFFSLLLCFDYSADPKSTDPPVVGLRYSPISQKIDLVPIATNFTDFENRLFSEYLWDIYAVKAKDRSQEEIWTTICNTLRLTKIPPSIPFEDDLGEGERNEWQQAPLADTNSTCAGLFLMKNRTVGGFYDFPEHPDAEWILAADIHPRHRAELKRELAALPFECVNVFEVDWRNWSHAVTEEFRQELKRGQSP